MGSWFKRTKRNGLTITTSSKGTTWSKSTKGGSVRHTVTHRADGKIIQTTTQRAPGGFVRIEKKTLNRKPIRPPKSKPVKMSKPRKVRYSRRTPVIPISVLKWGCLLYVIVLLLNCHG